LLWKNFFQNKICALKIIHLSLQQLNSKQYA